MLPSEEKRHKVKELCRIRWAERHDALAVASCLEEIAHTPPADWNRDTRSDAQSLLLALSQFSFVVTLYYLPKGF